MQGLDQQLREMENALNAIATKEIPRVHASAANKTIGKVRTQVVKIVSRETGVKSKIIRKRFVVQRAKPSFLRARVSVWQQSVNVADVARNAAPGKKVRVAGKVYPRSFYNNAKSGKLLALQRKGSARYGIEIVKIDIKQSIDKHLPKISEELMRLEHPKLVRRELLFRINKYAKFN